MARAINVGDWIRTRFSGGVVESIGQAVNGETLYRTAGGSTILASEVKAHVTPDERSPRVTIEVEPHEDRYLLKVWSRHKNETEARRVLAPHVPSDVPAYSWDDHSYALEDGTKLGQSFVKFEVKGDDLQDWINRADEYSSRESHQRVTRAEFVKELRKRPAGIPAKRWKEWADVRDRGVRINPTDSARRIRDAEGLRGVAVGNVVMTDNGTTAYRRTGPGKTDWESVRLGSSSFVLTEPRRVGSHAFVALTKALGRESFTEVDPSTIYGARANPTHSARANPEGASAVLRQDGGAWFVTVTMAHSSEPVRLRRWYRVSRWSGTPEDGETLRRSSDGSYVGTAPRSMGHEVKLWVEPEATKLDEQPIAPPKGAGWTWDAFGGEWKKVTSRRVDRQMPDPVWQDGKRSNPTDSARTNASVVGDRFGPEVEAAVRGLKSAGCKSVVVATQNDRLHHVYCNDPPKPRERHNPTHSAARANPSPARARFHAAFERERAAFAKRYPRVASAALEIQDGYSPEPGACGGFRDIAYADRKRNVVVVASRILRWKPDRWLGIIRHELGHLSDPRFSVDAGAEKRADAIALEVTGVPIRYDEKDVQNVKRGRTLRPKHLRKNPIVEALVGGAAAGAVGAATAHALSNRTRARRNPASAVRPASGGPIINVTGPMLVSSGFVDLSRLVLVQANGKRVRANLNRGTASLLTPSINRINWVALRRGGKWNRELRRVLKGKAGVYAIRKRGTKTTLYVGEGGKRKHPQDHLYSKDPDRLFRTILRHFQEGFTPEKYAEQSVIASKRSKRRGGKRSAELAHAQWDRAEKYRAGGREWVYPGSKDDDLEIAVYLTAPREARHHEGRFILELQPTGNIEYIAGGGDASFEFGDAAE